MQSRFHFRRPVVRRVLLLLFALTLGWAIWLMVMGGFDRTLLRIRIRSNDPRRVLIVSACALLGYVLAGGAVPLSRFVVHGRRAFTLLAARPGGVAATVALGAVLLALAQGTRIAGDADAYGYVSQADLWLAGDLKVPQPWVEEVPWPNSKWSFTPLGYRPMADEWSIVPTYSPGLPMLMAAAKWLGGQCALFAVVPLSLGLAVFTTYVLGKRIGTESEGLMAAWLLATSPVVLEVALESLSDVPVMAAWSAAFYFLLGTNVASASLSGFAAALAILIRPNLVPLVIPLAAWFVLRRTPAARVSTRLVYLAVFSAAVLPGVLVVAALNRHLYGSASSSGYGDLRELFSAAHVLPNLRRFVVWIVETQSPLALLGVAALIVPLRAVWPRVADRRLFAVIALFIALLWGQYSAYLEFESAGYLRFLLPSWPLIMLATVAVLVAIGRLTIQSVRARVAGIMAVVILLGLWNIRVAVGRDVFEQRQAARHEAPIGRLVQTHTQPNSVVLAVHRSGSMRYYAGRTTMRYDMLDGDWLDRAVAWLTERGVHVYALLDERETAESKTRFAGQRTAAAFDRPVLTYKPASTSLFDLSAPPDASRPTVVITEALPDLPGCDPPVRLRAVRLSRKSEVAGRNSGSHH